MTRYTEYYADLVCPNDDCPGTISVPGRPDLEERFTWTVGPHDRRDDAENCPECGTPGADQGDIHAHIIR